MADIKTRIANSIWQKAKSFLNTLAAFGMMGGIGWLLCSLTQSSFYYLRDAKWEPMNAEHFLLKNGLAPTWLIYPQSWLGLHSIVQELLSTLPSGFLLSVISMVIFYLANIENSTPQ